MPQTHSANEAAPGTRVVVPLTGQSLHLVLPIVALNVAVGHGMHWTPFEISNPGPHWQTSCPPAAAERMKPREHRQSVMLVDDRLRVEENSGHAWHAASDDWPGSGL